MLPSAFTPQLLRQLELFRLRTRRAYLGTRQGGHVSLKKGQGIEFSDYRKYEPGDNPRNIDWGVYARSDRLYVKRFQEDQSVSVLLIIDSSESMFTPESERKWEQARDIALALAYVALMEQDRVAISVPGILMTPFLSGAAAFHRLAEFLAPIRGKEIQDLAPGISEAVARVRVPGAAVLLSDFLNSPDRIEQIVNMLRAKNLEVTALQILGPGDLEPAGDLADLLAQDSETRREFAIHLGDAERAEYRSLLAEHNEGVANFLASCRIPFASTVSSEGLERAVFETLPLTGLLG